MSTFITRVGEVGNQVVLPLNKLQCCSVATIKRVDPRRCEGCFANIQSFPFRLNAPLCTGPCSVGDEFCSSLFLSDDIQVITPEELGSIKPTGSAMTTLHFLCGIQLTNT